MVRIRWGVFVFFYLGIIYFYHVLLDCNLFEINISDCKRFGLEILLCTVAVFARSARKDIWYFMLTFSNICRNLTALVVRIALRSIESSLQVRFSRLALNAVLLNTLRYLYNTPEHRRNAFLASYLSQG